MSIRKTWSPIDCMPGAKLTESGLLEMQNGEVLLWTKPDVVEIRAAVPDEAMVALTFGGNLANTQGKTWVDRSLDCLMTITSHRIVFQQTLESDKSAKGMARFIHLSNLIADTQLEKGTMFKSARILLGTALGELYVIFRGDKGATNSKDAMQCIETAMRRKEWENEAKVQKMEEEVQNSGKVGVDAILSRNQARHQQAATVTSQAFTGDVDTLMEQAQPLIKIIEKYVSTLDKHEGSSSSSEEDKDRLASMLQNMGMTAALSKADYKGREDAYYATLARQLADFLRPKLKHTMMTLTDVYCLYNRARGSNLISPEDLLEAVDQMEKLDLGLSHHQFPSGLRVLQDAALNQDQMAERLKEIAQNGVTEVEASVVLHISVLLAQEQLLEAERHGSLVRDETTESVQFYPNRFDEWTSEIQLSKPSAG